MPETTDSRLDTVIVTGLSGAGKSTALGVLEDAGYFTVDNLPSAMVDTLLTLLESNDEVVKVALAADSRDPTFPGSVDSIITACTQRGHTCRVLFLDASDEVLLRRYSETRRRHPLLEEAGGMLSKAVQIERDSTRTVRGLASEVLDTSSLTIHELKTQVRDRLLSQEGASLEVVFMSFGFKHGLPGEASYVFDVRFLPNPFFVSNLQGLTGLDEEIQSWLDQWKLTGQVFERLQHLLDLVIPASDDEGKASLAICVGCTGGRHRSVMLTERLAAWCREQHPDWRIRLIHRDISKGL